MTFGRTMDDSLESAPRLVATKTSEKAGRTGNNKMERELAKRNSEERKVVVESWMAAH
jgi:hypothetical protein